MKKLTRTPTRLTLAREVVRTLVIAPTELHHVAGAGLWPARTPHCSTGETTWV